ncbi:MAG: SGNH/GDSL hydrolase family protein [Acidimicrobiales bacterium]
MRRRGAVVLAAVVLAGVAVVGALAGEVGSASADGVALWERTYVAPQGPVANDTFMAEVQGMCAEDLERGTRSNATVGPRIAVVGDSVQVQTRRAALADPALHWDLATHCGENLSSVVDSGRLQDAVGAHADALVVALGTNDLSYFWQVTPDRLPAARAALGRVLDASSSVRCRVLVNLPRTAPAWVGAADQATWRWLTDQVNDAFAEAARTRPGVVVADWAALVDARPDLLQEGQHVTHTGINARLNLTIAAARRCWAPDAPPAVVVVPGNQVVTAWWPAAPAPEAVGGYRVEVSDGRVLASADPVVNVGGLPNGVPARVRVRAVNPSGTSPPTGWSSPVVPSAAGARFHPVVPTRVADTRVPGGPLSGRLGAGETRRIPVAALVPAVASASALALEVTAVGATTDTFVTVHPGDRSRPLTSNLNPRAGVAAVAAMVTTPVDDGTVAVFNNAGTVDVVVDLVGWYDAPGSGTGALLTPLGPTRILDSRDGTGTANAPFAAADQRRLVVPGLPPGATAVVVNATATGTTADGFVTLFPGGSTRPLASQLNPRRGATVANLVVVGLGPGGTVDVYNHAARTDVVLDLVGAFGPAGAAGGGAAYFPLSPTRVVDTRDGTGGVTGPVGGATPTVLALAGRGGVPAAGVVAVDANLTVVAPSTAGHTTTWPAGPRPLASVLNFGAGEVVANRDLVAVDAAGTTRAWSVPPSIHYVVDVSGWFGPGG